MRVVSLGVLLNLVCIVTYADEHETTLQTAEDATTLQAVWSHGPSADESYFPIGVWAQDPRHAMDYSKLGINIYLSLPGGPTDAQLELLKAAGMQTICRQNTVGLRHLDNPTIIGWMHGDEPDNFTKNAEGKWVPKRSSQEIIADYQRLVRNDPSRPVLLNLGQGVSNDFWKGGWAKEPDYRQFLKGCDIVSYDIYPACSTRKEVSGQLELCAKGVSRLQNWSGGQKAVWFVTEAAHIQNPNRIATPHEMRFEVWSSIIHGARGIVYFCHQWQPKRDFAVPLQDPQIRDSVTTLNTQIAELAPVLNSRTADDPSPTFLLDKDAGMPIAVLRQEHKGSVYLFAAAMGEGSSRASFEVPATLAENSVDVLGEDRTLSTHDGEFSDTFSTYDIHIYRLK